jgi:hypothetical protein
LHPTSTRPSRSLRGRRNDLLLVFGGGVLVGFVVECPSHLLVRLALVLVELLELLGWSSHPPLTGNGLDSLLAFVLRFV